MKIQSIITISTFIIIVVSYNELTAEENDKRLETCGNEHIGKPSKNSIISPVSWLTKLTRSEISAPAVIISPRHLITSSRLFLTKSAWKNSGDSIDCDDSIKHLEVPVNKLSDVIEPCLSQKENCSPKVMNFARAYILNFCKSTLVQKRVYSFPMILELDENLEGNSSYPCLADESIKLAKGDAIDAYGCTNNSEWKHRKVNVGAGVSPDILYGTVPNTEKGFDLGPLTKNDSGRVWMVGFDLAATIGSRKYPWYYKMSSAMYPALCELAGICSEASTTTTVQPSTASTAEPTDSPEPPSTSPSGAETTEQPEEIQID
ncbi:C-type LECtin [Caenorhabditis elegans]|uniref:C-type LECtin n=1 Tax=Caenorhabditis elegans TaxID=6239 RepID=Q9XWZ8_CAEEL|nr:C-type LECtin [Caenorhabditis elegans]CAA21047.2 C-type LECtin [Caenorhabditis elegans]|eukprot:NP_492993.2 Uncharacterized protein CELE_Y47H9B.2 [Caenorhabditis elegans]